MRRADCAAPKAKLTNLVESKVSPRREAGKPDICPNLSERWIRREAGKPEICNNLSEKLFRREAGKPELFLSQRHAITECTLWHLPRSIGDPALISPNEQPKNNYTFTVTN